MAKAKCNATDAPAVLFVKDTFVKRNGRLISSPWMAPPPHAVVSLEFEQVTVATLL